MSETERITRFRKCRKIKLKDLVETSILIPVGTSILSALVLWLMGSKYVIYAWVAGIIVFGVLVPAWYIIILFDCDRLASSTLPDCISKCREKYCISKCPNEAYTWCIDMCREIFGYDP
jgi:hypothetical protein